MQVKPRTALFLLPNAITTAAMFAGFYAILQAVGGNWRAAAFGVFAAALLDACDGRVARWTNTDSVFGIEYDSLSDTVSFGVAPAVLFYLWSLHAVGNIGLGAAFCYCAATALRLARFNCQTRATDRRYFIGMPSPAAAALAVSYVAIADDYGVTPPPLVNAGVCVFLALNMVSNMRFLSFKGLNLRNRISFHNGVLLLIVGAIVLNAVSDNIVITCGVLLFAYLASGYIMGARSLWQLWRRRRAAAAPPRP